MNKGTPLLEQMWRGRASVILCSILSIFFLAVSATNAAFLTGAIGFGIAAIFKWRALIANAQLVTTINSMGQPLSEMSDYLNNLNSENDTLRHRAQTLELEIASLRTSQSRIEMRELDQARELEEADNRIADLVGKLGQEKKRSEKLLVEIDDLKNSTRRQSTESQSLKLDIQDLNEHLKQREIDLKAYDEKLNEAADEIRVLTEKLDSSEESRLLFNDKVREKDETIDQLKRWINMNTENQKATADMKQHTSEAVEKLIDQNTVLKIQLSKEKQSLHTELKKLNGSMNALKTAAQQLKIDMTEMIDSSENIRANLFSKAEAIASKSSEITTLAEKSRSISEICSSLTSPSKAMMETARQIEELSNRIDIISINLGLSNGKRPSSETSSTSTEDEDHIYKSSARLLGTHAAHLSTFSSSINREGEAIQLELNNLSRAAESLNDIGAQLDSLNSIKRELEGIVHQCRGLTESLTDCTNLSDGIINGTDITLSNSKKLTVLLNTATDMSEEYEALLESFKEGNQSEFMTEENEEHS